MNTAGGGGIGKRGSSKEKEDGQAGEDRGQGNWDR